MLEDKAHKRVITDPQVSHGWVIDMTEQPSRRGEGEGEGEGKWCI